MNGSLILVFVHQLVRADPRHHRTQLRSGLFDRVRFGLFARGFQFGLACAILPLPR